VSSHVSEATTITSAGDDRPYVDPASVRATSSTV
jgi:hypothetical protein